MVAAARQAAFDELGTPLRETTFLVLDLETTGGSPATSAITEVGAVRVRGGEVLAELSTLVDPGHPIPALISVLTGITDSMVAGSPRIRAVLPSVLDLMRGAVLVAHNAPFDVGFLRAACDTHGYDWPGPPVLDTARLARRVLTRDEAPDCKLATLARVLRARTQPTHRALDDARATVDVLHTLVERVAGLGVHSWEELRDFSGRVSPEQRRKRHLAEGLPTGPGVYLFRDGSGRVLYVGTSRSVRARVRQYFVASEPRTRMAEMVAVAERVDAVPCAHALEAEVRELRLIAEHRPRYNRRSTHPERVWWLRLTEEAFPRLSLVRSVPADAAALGPFGSRRTAELVQDALYEAFPLRRCTQRLSPRRPAPTCALAGMGRCPAPCEQAVDVAGYAPVAEGARAALTRRPDEVVAALRERIDRLTQRLAYEDAAVVRDRMTTYVRALARLQRVLGLVRLPLLVAAAPGDRGGWELAATRHGRLVASAATAAGAAVLPHVPGLVASAETVLPVPGPLPAATVAETERILRWLGQPGVRLLEVDGGWSSPADGAGRAAAGLAGLAVAHLPGADRRGLRPLHRPAR